MENGPNQVGCWRVGRGTICEDLIIILVLLVPDAALGEGESVASDGEACSMHVLDSQVLSNSGDRIGAVTPKGV